MYVDGQQCIQNPDINIQGDAAIENGTHMISPSFTFSCNGRITSVTASLFTVEGFSLIPGMNLPVFQVWRPLLPGSSIYSIIGQAQFDSGVFYAGPYLYTSTILLTRDDRIEFQSGDVIGCYQPNYPLRLVQIITIDNVNYISYFSHTTNPTTATINISSTDYVDEVRQPLINITTGKYTCCISAYIYA